MPENAPGSARAITDTLLLDPALGDRLAARLVGFPFAQLDPGGVTSPSTLRVLALATLLQSRERLSDPQTVHALQFRPDWQAALQLPPAYPGMDPGVLCEFRQHLRRHADGCLVFQALLNRVAGTGLVSCHPDQPLTAGELLAEVCGVHRLAQVIEAATQLIEALATSHPEWFGTVVLPHWYTRYHPGDARQRASAGSGEQLKLVHTIGADLTYLLGILATSCQPGLAQLPEVATARQVWHENFEPLERPGLPTQAMWRTSACARCKQALTEEPQNDKT